MSNIMKKLLCYFGIHFYKNQIKFIQTHGEKNPAYYDYQCIWCKKIALDK